MGVPVIGQQAVLEALGPRDAVEAVRRAFVLHHRGEWSMPAKVYLEAPPNGDFRAMPARGDGYAVLKWVTSFPANRGRGLPVVRGLALLSSATDGAELAVIECASLTSLRTGAAAAVSAQALAAPGARSVGVVGCGVNGAWAARCLAAVGYSEGVCADVRPPAAEALAAELGWRAGERAEAAAQPVVVTVTPGSEPVIFAEDLTAGQHLAVLGADAHGKAELQRTALSRCSLFCDEWEQAAGGGELAGPVGAGEIERSDVTELGAVLAGDHPGRRGVEEITLFDSTGLAIQDLALAIAVYERWRAGGVTATEVDL